MNKPKSTQYLFYSFSYSCMCLLCEICVCAYVDAGVGGCWFDSRCANINMHIAEDNFQKSVLCLYYVSHRDWTHLFSYDSKCKYSLSYFVRSMAPIFFQKSFFFSAGHKIKHTLHWKLTIIGFPMIGWTPLSLLCYYYSGIIKVSRHTSI